MEDLPEASTKSTTTAATTTSIFSITAQEDINQCLWAWDIDPQRDQFIRISLSKYSDDEPKWLQIKKFRLCDKATMLFRKDTQVSLKAQDEGDTFLHQADYFHAIILSRLHKPLDYNPKSVKFNLQSMENTKAKVLLNEEEHAEQVDWYSDIDCDPKRKIRISYIATSARYPLSGTTVFITSFYYNHDCQAFVKMSEITLLFSEYEKLAEKFQELYKYIAAFLY